MFSAAHYAGRTNDKQKTMPGGVGPVSDATVSACNRQDREISSAKNSNEIFFNLDSRRVFYDSSEHYLYFVDSPDGLVVNTIRASLTGLNSSVAIEQIYLDPHKYFTGARRVKLTAAQAGTLLIALQLAGIRTTVR